LWPWFSEGYKNVTCGKCYYILTYVEKVTMEENILPTKNITKMKCPKCSSHNIKPWGWFDGGYKGVKCCGCNTNFWSEEFESRAYDAEKAAIKKLLLEMDFPADYQTDEDYKKQRG
jgi:transposase-like protein